MIKLILILFFSLSVSAFEIQKVTDVVGAVMNMKLDSHRWNCSLYNYEAGDYYRYYKLNANRGATLQVNFTMIFDMVMNSKDDVYIFGSDTVDSIYLVEANSNELQTIFKYPSTGYLTGEAFVDDEDNLLFNTKDGIVMLRSGEQFPVAVKYLESYYFKPANTVVDDQGNIYLAEMKLYQDESEVFVITSERKHQPVPSAELVEGLWDPNEVGKKSYEIGKDSQGNILFSVQYFNSSGTVKILKNGTFEVVVSENDLSHYNFYAAGNRTYFLAGNPQLTVIDFVCYLYYIDEDGVLYKVNRTFDYSLYLSRHQLTSDEYGNIYFIDNDYSDVLMLRSNETEVVSLFKTQNEVSVLNICLESSGAVWAVGSDDYYYRIPTDPSWGTVGYQGSHLTVITAMEEAFGDIYIGSWDGLYVLLNF